MGSGRENIAILGRAISKAGRTVCCQPEPDVQVDLAWLKHLSSCSSPDSLVLIGLLSFEIEGLCHSKREPALDTTWNGSSPLELSSHDSVE
mmetsp:Transcript_11597/g.16756  ORF Transcript_11597/g.16756 Transcript_11597/m.16756 type:complete len:91 (+) Transcript_11597:273-545(+)